MKYTLDSYVPKSSFIASSCCPVQDLIAFGDEKYNEYVNSGYLLLKMSIPDGKGFIAYEILEGTIEVRELFIEEGVKSNVRDMLYEGLVYSLRNMAASQRKPLVLDIIETDDDKPGGNFDKFIRKRNDHMKENKVEDKYKWKIEKSKK